MSQDLSIEAQAQLETRAALALQLRAARVRDVALMRAFEQTPRELFASHRLRDLASRDISLPIGCGQTMSAPSDLARRLESLGVVPGSRVLEVGAGSGYSAAILSRLAREVVSLERFETLAAEARARLAAIGVNNVCIIRADGLAARPELGEFDRVIVHFALASAPETLLARVSPGGVLGFGRHVAAEQGGIERPRWIRLERNQEGAFLETDFGPCRLGAAIEGLALAL